MAADSTKPSKEKFAQAMIAALRRAGESAGLRYDPEQFRILTEGAESQVFNLANIYQEYCDAAVERRPEVLRHIVRSWFARHKEVPKHFEDVHPDLLPGVRNRSYYELTALQARVEGLSEFEWPTRVLGEHLAVGLVYDLPESIMQLQQHHLADWGVSFDDALKAACRNLLEISQDPFDNPAPGVWRSPWQDNHDAARMVLLEVLRQYEVRGDPVVMVPNRDTLLLAGAEDDDALSNLIELAMEAFDHPRSLSGLAWRLRGDQWRPFVPEAEHSDADRFQALRVQTFGRDYNDQKELLDTYHEKTQRDVFVASFNALQHSETGRIHSYSVWSNGVDTYLPSTDVVHFFQPSGEEEGEIVASTDWERVREVVGHLMEDVGLYPYRYRVRKFPGEKELTALRGE